MLRLSSCNIARHDTSSKDKPILIQNSITGNANSNKALIDRGYWLVLISVVKICGMIPAQILRKAPNLIVSEIKRSAAMRAE